MDRHHNLTLDVLTELNAPELNELTVAALAYLNEQVAELKKTADTYAATLHATYERRFAERAKALLRDKGQDTGTAHIEAGGFDVTVNVPKKVEWDQELLKAALDAMPAELAKHLAKVEVKVDERKYGAAIALPGFDPDIKTKLEAARTVKPGKVAFEFKQLEQEAA